MQTNEGGSSQRGFENGRQKEKEGFDLRERGKMKLMELRLEDWRDRSKWRLSHKKPGTIKKNSLDIYIYVICFLL